MPRTARLALALCLALAAGPASPQQPGSKPDLRPPPQAGLHAGETKCGACHSTDSWGDVAFAHERTGFPLRGTHARLGCKDCHAQDFDRALGRTCSSCHRDVHQGRLSARCASCHTEESWRSSFGADAHRRGDFPLTGRHAFIACEECHGDRRDRGFARATKTCFDCHQANYQHTRGTAIDHVAAGFPTACQDCHQTWKWTGAFFAAHENCFPISSGPHHVSCLKCHTSLAGFAVTGQCATNTAACTRCHGDSATTPRHASVPGYQWRDRKCYECHVSGIAGGGLSRGLRRKP